MQTLPLETATKIVSKPALSINKNTAITTKSEEPRLGWIDYARGISIIMVVFSHTALGFKSIIFNGSPLNIDFSIDNFLHNIFTSRMPLFFIVTGIFIQNSYLKRGLSGFIKYKFSTIFYPFLIWVSLQILFQVIGNKFGGSATIWTAKDLLSIILFPHKLYQFWFLYAMFEVVVVYALIHYFFRLTI